MLITNTEPTHNMYLYLESRYMTISVDCLMSFQVMDRIDIYVLGSTTCSVEADEWIFDVIFTVPADEWDFEKVVDLTPN